METKLYTLTGSEKDDTIYKEAGEIIKCGGLVAFPTETVYGLGGDALNPAASGKIYAAKGRPSDNPLIVHIADLEDVKKIAKDIGEDFYALADAFWPGPLTIVLNKSDCVPVETTGGLDTVAVRMPQTEGALGLIRNSGGYIAAPSANKSGRPSPTKASHVWDDMEGIIDMILDGGEVGIGVESTIVDLTGDVPMLLRPGYITVDMLSFVLKKEVLIDPSILEVMPGQFRPKAPGMKYKHYAPKGELYVVKGTGFEAVAKKINNLAIEDIKNGERVGIIATKENESLYHEGIIKCIGSRADEVSIAHNLFSVLREFDDEKVTRIYSEELDTPKLGMAVMNRLMKAAAHKIIEC